MHNRLVRLILKVAIPPTLKVWRRPFLHLSQFLLSRTNLDTGVNAIGSQWSRAFDVPLIKDRFLDFWDAADEVVEALRI